MNDSKITCVRDCADKDMIIQSRSEINEMKDSFRGTAVFYQILGNQTRLKILWLIQTKKSICVCDLSDILEVSISAISQQLKKMKDFNLLINTKVNQTVYYAIHPDYQSELNKILTFNTVKL